MSARSILIFCLVGALLLGVFVVGHGSGPSGPIGSSAASPCIQHEVRDANRVDEHSQPIVTIHRTDNTSQVRFAFNGTGGEPMFDVSLPDGLRVMNSSGFDYQRGVLQRNYTAEQPWVEVSLGSPYRGVELVATEENVVTPLPQSSEVDLYFQPNATGFVGGHFAAVGDYTVGTAHAGCQQIQIVAPEGAALPKDTDAYARAVAGVGRELAIGHRYKVVTGFVAPRDTGRRNGYTPRGHSGDGGAAEFYVSPTSQLSNPRNTWVHEYIHTRQASFSPRWLAEGSATFFTAQYSVRERWISPSQYDAFFAREANANGTIMTQNYTKGSYYRGAAFFAQVHNDLEGTNTTVEDVYRELNRDLSANDHSSTAIPSVVESVVESRTSRSVDYVSPMENPPKMAYLVDLDWVPLTLRRNAPSLVSLASLWLSMLLALGVWEWSKNVDS